MLYVHIYKIKLHTKNHVDWIKNEVTGEVYSLLYSIPDTVDIFDFLKMFEQYSCD